MYPYYILTTSVWLPKLTDSTTPAPTPFTFDYFQLPRCFFKFVILPFGVIRWIWDITPTKTENVTSQSQGVANVIIIHIKTEIIFMLINAAFATFCAVPLALPLRRRWGKWRHTESFFYVSQNVKTCRLTCKKQILFSKYSHSLTTSVQLSQLCSCSLIHKQGSVQHVDLHTWFCYSRCLSRPQSICIASWQLLLARCRHQPLHYGGIHSLIRTALHLHLAIILASYSSYIYSRCVI